MGVLAAIVVFYWWMIKTSEPDPRDAPREHHITVDGQGVYIKTMDKGGMNIQLSVWSPDRVINVGDLIYLTIPGNVAARYVVADKFSHGDNVHTLHLMYSVGKVNG
jgi:hypothetical protein